MSPKLTEYHVAILHYLTDNKFGKRRVDKIYDEFESEILDHDQIEDLLEDLHDCGYIKKTEIDAQRIWLSGEDLTPRSDSKSGYKITPLGKSRVGNVSATVYSNITNSNIAHQSPNAVQSIKISEQSEDIQQMFTELQNAIAQKDSSAMKKTFGYIADKSVDVAIAILTGAVIS